MEGLLFLAVMTVLLLGLVLSASIALVLTVVVVHYFPNSSATAWLRTLDLGL